MNKKAIEELHLQEVSYWWHKGRRIVMDSVLKRTFSDDKNSPRILDVGCGTGVNLSLFAKFGEVHGIDLSPEAVRYCYEAGFQNVQEGRAEALPYFDEHFDIVCAIELLEHIPRDVQVLNEFSRVLKRRGMLFLTVPAYSFLWSEHDEALGHVRRYTARSLQQSLEEAEFDIEKMSYMVTFTAPLFFYRFLRGLMPSKRREPRTSYVELPRFLNDLLVSPFRWEARIMQNGSLPFGTSLLCVARKRAKDKKMTKIHPVPLISEVPWSRQR